MTDKAAIIQRVYDDKIIVIVRGVYGEAARKLVEALCAGGISMIEFTFDQAEPENWEKTCDNIRMVCRDYGERMYAGAGTVLKPEQVRLAHEAGAGFIVTPNTKEAVIREAAGLGMVVMAGAMTPSEVVDAHDYGSDFVKLFPIAQLGSSYVKALRGPLNHIPLLAVGGVNADNIGDFLAAGCVGAGVGGELVSKRWIAQEKFELITEAAEKLVKSAHGEER